MDAGPEVDAAWKSLGVDCKFAWWSSSSVSNAKTICTVRALGVPAEQAAKSGLLPDQVKVNKKYGGMYPANVEGLHQLHCLVSLFFFLERLNSQLLFFPNPLSLFMFVHACATERLTSLKQNLMRKALWYNFDYYHKQGLGPFSNNDPVLKAHVSKYHYPCSRHKLRTFSNQLLQT